MIEPTGSWPASARRKGYRQEWVLVFSWLARTVEAQYVLHTDTSDVLVLYLSDAQVFVQFNVYNSF